MDGVRQNNYADVELAARKNLRNTDHMHHLFIPDIAKIFYRFDIGRRSTTKH